jgi:predicted ATPase
MDRSHVRQMRVVNVGCVKDVTIDLTPLHAFVGPNDSGKSTLLGALRKGVLGYQATRSFVTLTVGQLSRTWAGDAAILHGANLRYEDRVVVGPAPKDDEELRAATDGCRLLRLDPDEMRRPTQLIPQERDLAFSERGRGLAGVYDALLSRRRKVFDEINTRFRSLFPTVDELQLVNSSDVQKVLGIRLRDGAEVPADAMSEGMLYWLAFAALPYLSSSSVCLVEEPENGLHPARVAEVVRVLREASRHTQILLATHSPLLINELQPDELWLSYADGNLEEKLVGDGDGNEQVAAVAEP